MTDPKPNHPWNGERDSLGYGHNCRDCDKESVWRCDEAAHCPHKNITGAGHDQTMQCDDCGHVFTGVPE